MQKRYFHLLHSFGVSFKLYPSALPPPLKSVRKINSLLFSPSKFALALLLRQSFFLLITALLMVLGIYPILVASETSSESGGCATTQKFERSLFYFVCSLQIYKHDTYIKFHMIFIEPYFGRAYLE